MELDNFFLTEYDSKNIDHKTVIIKLENADLKDKYLGNLEYHIEKTTKRREYNRCNHAYISYYDDIPKWSSRKLAKLVGFERQNTVKYTQRRM